jgi:hypothetical protein
MIAGRGQNTWSAVVDWTVRYSNHNAAGERLERLHEAVSDLRGTPSMAYATPALSAAECEPAPELLGVHGGVILLTVGAGALSWTHLTHIAATNGHIAPPALLFVLPTIIDGFMVMGSAGHEHVSVSSLVAGSVRMRRQWCVRGARRVAFEAGLRWLGRRVPIAVRSRWRLGPRQVGRAPSDG